MTTKEQSFAELLDKYDYKFNKGDLIKGIVVGYDSNSVLVDIGAKATASVPNREIKTDNKTINNIIIGLPVSFNTASAGTGTSVSFSACSTTSTVTLATVELISMISWSQITIA